MNSRAFIVPAAWLALACCAHAIASDLVVYDDASKNGFDQNCSFNDAGGDFNFANTNPVHSGTDSIRLTPENYNAVSWCTPVTLATTTYSGISFWVNGGASGGEDLDVAVALTGTRVAHASLATLYGQALPANTWVHITASFDAAPTQYSGSFDQFWVGSNTDGVQPDVYVDDVSLIGRVSVNDKIFANGFEVAAFRGTNLAGMEMAYFNFNQTTGPVPDTDYPVYDTRVIDYFASKRIAALRFLFSWEGMQSTLNGPIPASPGGNYKAYFDNYKRIVDYATNVEGMQVVIEPWDADSGGGAGGARWRGDLVGSAQVPMAAFADFWGKMAALFKDNPRVSFGLINEPNNMSTMTWFAAAQLAITAIRDAGSTQRIYVPGNGYTTASAWTANYYDTAATQRSNAYGWLNANGVGAPLADPLNNIVIEVHTYLDADQCACGANPDEITSITAARTQIAVTLDWATANGYQMYLGEIGMYAGNASAAAAWADYIDYFNSNAGPFVGFTWWAGGMPDWWNDLHGPHFAISPTNDVDFTGDTVNMQLIENDF
ncbi:MAG: cellulase family glycosylhydrolase [Rudaea sp.]